MGRTTNGLARQVSRLQLEPSEISKGFSFSWDAKNLVQWLDAFFLNDEIALNKAYGALTEEIASWMKWEISDITTISEWCERMDVDETAIAAVWNNAMRRFSETL